MQFSEAVEGFWLTNKRNRSEATFASYSRIYRSIQEWLEDKEIEEVTARDVNGYLNYLEEERCVQAQTIMNHWIALSAFWTWASPEFEIPHVVKNGVPRPKVPKKMREPHSEAEVKLIRRGVQYMKSYDPANEKYVEVVRRSYVRDAAVIAVLLDTGIRAAELCALNIADFDRQYGRLNVLHGKGNKQRILPMGDRSRKRLWKYMSVRKEYDETDPLFITQNKKRLTRDYLFQIVSRAGSRYGVKGAGPHRFRHTFAINFLRNGGSPLELQRILGHEKLETVLIYVQLAEVDIESAQKRASVGDAWVI